MKDKGKTFYLFLVLYVFYRYLSKFGGKRNTVHGALPYGPSSPIARHARGPYAKAPSTERFVNYNFFVCLNFLYTFLYNVNLFRRSSWASPAVTAQQHAQLERIYKQAVHTSSCLFMLLFTLFMLRC